MQKRIQSKRRHSNYVGGIKMKIEMKKIEVKTKKELEMINLTEKVRELLQESGLKNGIISLFVQGSTAALSTIEFEPGLLKDFPRFLDKIIPKNESYAHQLMWHDNNGHSHVRASLLKPDLVIPFQKGEMVLGTWQQIFLIELNISGRNRNVFMQILGE